MALSRQTMTDEQRKSVALEYFKALDNGGTTSHRRQHPRPVRRRRPDDVPEVGPGDGQGGDRPPLRRRGRHPEGNSARLRCFIYLDPDYAGKDIDRYPWLSAGGRDPSQPMG
jgi:hypothetical protein